MRRNRLTVFNLVNRVRHCRGVERRAARQQVIEDGAQRIDITFRANLIAQARSLLRRRETRRTDHLSGERQFRIAL